MRVLMFGWEFPPHISGGLGTACFGLTQSLVRENVELTFVVPKLFGSETAGPMNLISASKIVLPIDGEKPVAIRRTVRKEKAIPRSATEIKVSRAQKTKAAISYVEVEAALDPYTSTASLQEQKTLTNWNYVFEEKVRRNWSETITWEEIEEDLIKPKGYTYNFSGSYGSNLFEEVNAYAKVAGQLAREYAHDVIHAHDWMTFAAGIEAKKISGKPLVVHVHATEHDRSGHLAGPVYEWEKRGMAEADRIVAVSKWTKNILVNRYGIPAEQIEVVHNGINTGENSIIESSGLFGSQVVTFLGRVTQQKGPGYFIEAASKVVEKFPDAHFIVAGSGDLLPRTIERVAELRLSDRFHFTGFLDRDWINKVWSMSDVYVMPSVSEPFGITPLEAVQAGVPVILSNQCGVAEVMPDALKVDFWDVEALAESICSVLSYKSLSSMLKTRGEEHVKKLSWGKAAVKLKSLYEELTTTPN